jgi:hypothetical protein
MLQKQNQEEIPRPKTQGTQLRYQNAGESPIQRAKIIRKERSFAGAIDNNNSTID